MESTAVFTEDNRHRYSLSRIWDSSKDCVLFILFNPSSHSNEMKDSKTMKKCRKYAESWGYGGFYVGNLYTYCSTDPSVIARVPDPVGPEHLQYLKEMIPKCSRVVYAYGHNESEPDWLRNVVVEPYCIEVSKKNVPKHPLYLKSSLPCKPFVR